MSLLPQILARLKSFMSMTNINQNLRHLRSSASYYLRSMTHPPSTDFSQAPLKSR